MYVFDSNLHKHTAAVGQQLLRHRQTIPQVGQIRMHPQRPGVTVGLDHLGLTRQVLHLVLDVALAQLRLKVALEADAVGWVDVDHLHLAGQVFTPRQAGHHRQAVAQDHAVAPVHVMAVELHRLGVALLRVGKQVAVHVLARQHPQHGLGADPLVDVQGHRVYFEPGTLPLAGPFQPGLMPAQRVGQHLRLFLAKGALAGGLQQCRQAISGSRVGGKPQHRRQVRVVVVADLG